MSHCYRVVDFTSNSPNTIYDYVIKPENNTIYRNFKAARCEANSRIKSYMDAAGLGPVPADVNIKQNQKKTCDTNGNLHSIITISPDGVQAMIMIIPVKSFKGDILPAEAPVRQSPRVRNRIVRPNYVEVISDSDEDSESDFVEVRPRVKKEKRDIPVVDDSGLPEVVGALSLKDEDPVSYPLPPPYMMDDDL